MAVGLYSGVSGLALGVGLYKGNSGLWGGASGLINGFGGSGPFPGSSLYLDFLTPPLDSRITFSRGSNATLVDATGKITYAPNNLIPYSTDATNAVWTKTNTTVAGGVSDPVGGTNAQTVTATTSAAQLYNFVSIGSAIGTKYLFSVWVRRRSGSGTISLFNPNATPSAIAVTSTWTQFFVSSNGGSGFIYPGFLLATSGDAIDIYFPVCAAVTYETAPRPADQVATTASAYYGPRFDYDPVTLAPKGLLIEEARTNLVTYSEQFDNAAWTKTNGTVTANATTAPSGTTTADTFIPNTNNNFHDMRSAENLSLAASANVLTIYVKAAGYNFVEIGVASSGLFTAYATAVIDLTNGTNAGTGVSLLWTINSVSVQNAGNGWYRVSLAFTPNASTGTGMVFLSSLPTSTRGVAFAGNGTSGAYIWGAQVEAGSFATSYIPTVASTVTRSADVATMTGTNFSSWYNQTAGSFVIDADFNGSLSANASPLAISGDLNNYSNWIAITRNATTNIFSYNMITASVTQSGFTNGAAVGNGVAAKAAFAFAANDLAGSTNGAAVTTDTSATLPAVTRLLLGREQDGSVFLNGHIRQIAYYNTRLPNAQLQTLTAPSLATTLSLSFTNQAYTVGV